MRQRRGQQRGTGNNRRMIGAGVIAGVLGLAAIGGVQLASAEDSTQANGIITVDGQQFDVSGCTELEINASTVLCDGAELAPASQGEGEGEGEGEGAAAAELEAACDLFASEAAGTNEEGENGEEGSTEDSAVTQAREALLLACLDLATAKGESEDSGATPTPDPGATPTPTPTMGTTRN